MLLKSFSSLPVSDEARARSCEEILFKRFMSGAIRRRQDLYSDLTTIAQRSTRVGQLVAVSSTFKVIETLITGSWLH